MAERVLVYDGYCHVCSGWAHFMERHAVTPPFELVPMQSGHGRARLIEYGIDPEDPATFLVLDGGRVYTDSDGVIQVVAALGGVWRLARAACVIPRRWRDALYRLLARNRYRWFGRRAVCHMPGLGD